MHMRRCVLACIQAGFFGGFLRVHKNTKSRVCLCVQISPPGSVSHSNKSTGDPPRVSFSIYCSPNNTGVCKTALPANPSLFIFDQCKVNKVCSSMFVS